MESGKSRQLRCMSFKCGVICDDQKVTVSRPSSMTVLVKHGPHVPGSRAREPSEKHWKSWLSSTPHYLTFTC